VPEVVLGIREKRPTFPCLLVSGLASARLVDSLLALGGVRFLKKPFTREELFYALRDLFTVEDAPPPSPPS
jgi:FixJ family two-component response regulator